MNVIIALSDLLGSNTPFGNDEGRNIYQKLAIEIDQHPNKSVFGISLKNIPATDASFPRESVIALIKSKRGEKGFYLENFSSQDLLDNWDYAAKAKDQPVIVLQQKGYKVIGPPLTGGTKELLDFIMQEKITTTSQVAERFKISAPNASAKLKKLLTQGLVLGTKEAAETGGLEFVYRAIK